MRLQAVSHTLAEAFPPPYANTTNTLQPFGHLPFAEFQIFFQKALWQMRTRFETVR